MKLLDANEAELNKAGSLSDVQFKQIRRQGFAQVILGSVFLAFMLIGFLMTGMKPGLLMYIWIGACILFVSVFAFSARSYLKIKQTGNNISSETGNVAVAGKGKRHMNVTINERSFFVLKNQAAGLEDGKKYTLYILEDPTVIIGWTN